MTILCPNRGNLHLQWKKSDGNMLWMTFSDTGWKIFPLNAHSREEDEMQSASVLFPSISTSHCFMPQCVKECCWSLHCHKLSCFQGLMEKRYQAALSSLASLHYDAPAAIVVFPASGPPPSLCCPCFFLPLPPQDRPGTPWRLNYMYIIEFARQQCSWGWDKVTQEW